MQNAIRDLAKIHLEVQAAPALHNVYEYGPCPICRETIIEQLHALDAVPDEIKRECHYDIGKFIRTFAEEHFSEFRP